MAELPDINEQIGKEQIDAATDNRQRLQKSLRAGLLNVVKSVDSMHNTLRDLYEMQKAGWDAQASQAGLDLEAAREASRSVGLGGAGGDGDVTVNGDVVVDAKKGGLLSGLGKKLGGIIGGLASSAGIGAGAFLAGAGILAGGAGYLLNALNDLDGANIKKQVVTLLSIGDEFEGGNWEFLKKGGAFLLAMTGIGLGLAVFGIGSSIAGMGDALNTFANAAWADSIKANVITLLSISDALGGAVAFIGDSAVFLLAMIGIGLGLAVFGIGGAIAGMGDALTNFVNTSWAESIKQNVVTLLSIKDELGGNWNMLADSAIFAAAMTGVGLGLAVFGAGSAVAGISDALTGFMNPDWATSIKNSVITLLSIKDSLGGNWEMLKDGGAFFLTMSGIGAGLAAFAFGSGAAGIAEAVNKFASEEDMADRIVRQVKTLLGVLDGENVTQERADIFSSVMGTIASGLLKFSGGKFLSGLLDAGAAVFNFLSGGESPIQEMIRVADRADDIFKGADAIDAVSGALKKLDALKFDGSKIKMTAFAEDLMNAIPAIETAIMGGTVGEGWISSGTKIKGLASPDVNFEQATKRIRDLQMALNPNAATATTGAEMDVRSTELAATRSAPAITDLSTTTAVTNNTQQSVNNTTVANISPTQNRRRRRSDRYTTAMATDF